MDEVVEGQRVTPVHHQPLWGIVVPGTVHRIQVERVDTGVYECRLIVKRRVLIKEAGIRIRCRELKPARELPVEQDLQRIVIGVEAGVLIVDGPEYRRIILKRSGVAGIDIELQSGGSARPRTPTPGTLG
jgi:hypothetical protein